ncbi:MAG: DNA-binding NarL/FixJ family response regulator [Candidatus Aldehydirespiratoraceae bacterium]|jgi:DNA-binding NarL/FixJ family response regulator
MDDERVAVVVAGDPAIANSLRTPQSDEINVVAHVPTGKEAVARVLTDLPDVLLLDIRIAESDARAVCRRIRQWAPATKIVAVTSLDDENAYTTVVAGAMGAVFLADDDATMSLVIQQVARGEAVLLPRIALRLLHDVDAWAERSADPIYPPPTLTATEREVLRRLGEGVDSEAIARSHGVTSHLVNLHAGFAVTKLHRYVHGAEHIAAESYRSQN